MKVIKTKNLNKLARNASKTDGHSALRSKGFCGLSLVGDKTYGRLKKKQPKK